MLMSSKWNRFAHLLLKARAKGVLLAPLSAAEDLTLDAAYEIAKCILDTRIAQGETPVGRKIGFQAPKRQSTGDSAAALSGPISAAISTPISTTSSTPVWAPLFDSTVHYATDNFALHSLMKAQQPCITPELVFKLRRTPDPDCTIEELADALEWIAHGFEITVSPFPDWQFEAADAVAAFGLHRALIIGEPRMLSTHTRRNLGEVLACASVSLSRSDQGSTVLCAAGFGSDAVDSPLHALWHLHQHLQQQSRFKPLQAGELISTGSWTHAQPVKRGEIWSSAFSQISLQGLNLSLS